MRSALLLATPLLAHSATFATREEFVTHLNALPGMTWRAGVVERFKGTPIGSSKSLLGVKPHSRNDLLARVADGSVASGPPSQYAGLPDPPDAFDSEQHWPQCAEIIGDIRDQSDCGCCWAFGAASAASDRMCIASNGTLKVPLSAQETCFCAESNGCNGGTLYTPWAYIQSEGLVTGGQFNNTGPLQPSKDSDAVAAPAWCSDFSLPHCHHHGPQGDDPFPAEGTKGCPKVTTSPQCPTTCDKDSTRDFAKDKYSFKGTVYMYPSNEKAIRQAIMQHGPVEAAFSVYADFENYVSGIYQHTSGQMLGGHAIRIVGWGTEAGVDYWKVANSWNPHWGEEGYFRIVRGANSEKGCGIESQVTASGPSAVWEKV